MKIVMVAGGSGGHIYPAVALANAMIEKGHEVSFIGASDRMEKDVIPAMGFEFIGLNVKTTRGGIFQKIKSLLSMGTSYLKSRSVLKGTDLVIGFGNYISVPVILAAKHMCLKTVLHEQNSFVGRANRMLDEKVDYIIGSYEENLKQFKNPHIEILGNPQSSKASKAVSDPKVIEDLGLDSNKKTVVIFMGSLGSESVMEHLKDYFELTDGTYQIIYATGVRHYQKAQELFKEKEYIKVFEKIDGIAVMKNADLLISRAGATTLAEVTAIGIPSILIPSPYVPNNHQYFNAKALTDEGAAWMLEEKDLSGKALNDLVNELINDDQKLKEIHTAARRLANDCVTEDIIERIEKL